MGPVEVGVLLVAGLAMGAINNLAGAAGVLGLIAFEDGCGLTADVANGSLRLAAVAIGVSGFVGFRSRGARVPPRAWALAAAALPGALIGVLLALRLPLWAYRSYLLAVMVAVLVQQLRNRGPGGAPHGGAAATVVAAVAIGAHMGFVQVGTGLVAILALSAVLSRDLVAVNTAKMAVVMVSSVTALACFAWSDKVAWPAAALLAAGAGCGSYLASRWSVRRGHGAVRVVVLVITVAVIARIGWQLLA